ncbi:hypothetical protein M5X04_00910 [Paenibacillus alvei]|uniref:Uncharacterized protein n=1 Tax=Paenibacillus alvei TaxID=44250 RepID=A0ABT4E2D6_PAEAL|nr:hypothetical protein [Paenibacillus alvei]MCY9527899.1 hypothetical protein [Paenibacillus alvei]
MMSYKKMIAVLSVSSMLIIASPISMEAAQSKQEVKQENGILKPEQIDKEILENLDAVYQELSGNSDLKMTWERITESPNNLYFFMGKDGNQAQVNQKTGEVQRATWFAKADQGNESLRTAAITAVKELDSSWNVSFNKVQRTFEKDTETLFTSFTGNNIWVSLDNDKVMSINLTYDYSKAPAKVKKGAEQVLQALDAKSFSIKEGTLNKAKDKSSWQFTAYKSKEKRIIIDVNGETGKATKFNQSGKSAGSLLDITDKKFSKFKNEDVLAAVKPLAKKVFGIDLTGYSVTRGKGEMANRFTFKKDGKPEVSGNINEKGEFYSLEVSGQ